VKIRVVLAAPSVRGERQPTKDGIERSARSQRRHSKRKELGYEEVASAPGGMPKEEVAMRDTSERSDVRVKLEQRLGKGVSKDGGNRAGIGRKMKRRRRTRTGVRKPKCIRVHPATLEASRRVGSYDRVSALDAAAVFEADDSATEAGSALEAKPVKPKARNLWSEACRDECDDTENEAKGEPGEGSESIGGVSNDASLVRRAIGTTVLVVHVGCSRFRFRPLNDPELRRHRGHAGRGRLGRYVGPTRDWLKSSSRSAVCLMSWVS
jgi:hypothetical protein